jgi:putative spermidine/putrescine transport system permease protein
MAETRAALPKSRSSRPLLRQISNYLYYRPRMMLFLLLGPPLLFMGVVYLGSLSSLLLNSFFYLDGFTGKIVHHLTLQTYGQLMTASNLDIFKRTITMALFVTVADALIAFPISYYTTKYASTRQRSLIFLAVLIPLWSSYLVRVYAWRLILAKEGILTWFIAKVGLTSALNWILSMPGIGGTSLGLSPIGMFIAFTYVWLPYMIIPIATALERVPRSLEDASSDLGARPIQTFRNVILPLAMPGVIAGSIFTFSLTLGDFVVPLSLGNSRLFIGMAVLSQQGTSGNIPLAAAFTMGPILIMIAYLLVARKMGAFDAL